jgi:hypothetical protein
VTVWKNGLPVPQGLPIDEWPVPDRKAWHEACRPGLRLERGGRASHLKPITQADYARRYGYFLDFLNRHGKLDLKASATSQITVEAVNAYLQELRDRVSSVTLYGSISKLRRAAELLQSDLNLGWLKEIEQDLDYCKRPRSKADRLVFSDKIIAAGFALMEAAAGQSVEQDLSVHLLPLARLDQQLVGISDRMERTIQPGLPEFEELIEPREVRSRVIILPNEALQQGFIVGHVIEDLGGSESMAAKQEFHFGLFHLRAPGCFRQQKFLHRIFFLATEKGNSFNENNLLAPVNVSAIFARPRGPPTSDTQL